MSFDDRQRRLLRVHQDDTVYGVRLGDVLDLLEDREREVTRGRMVAARVAQEWGRTTARSDPPRWQGRVPETEWADDFARKRLQEAIDFVDPMLRLVRGLVKAFGL